MIDGLPWGPSEHPKGIRFASETNLFGNFLRQLRSPVPAWPPHLNSACSRGHRSSCECWEPLAFTRWPNVFPRVRPRPSRYDHVDSNSATNGKLMVDWWLVAEAPNVFTLIASLAIAHQWYIVDPRMQIVKCLFLDVFGTVGNLMIYIDL